MSLVEPGSSELGLFDPPDWVSAPVADQIRRVLDRKIADMGPAAATDPDLADAHVALATGEDLFGLPNGPQKAATFFSCTSLRALGREDILPQALALLRRHGLPAARAHLVKRLLPRDELESGLRRKIVEFALQTDVLRSAEIANTFAYTSPIGEILTSVIGPSCLAHLRQHEPDAVMINTMADVLAFLKHLPGQENLSDEAIARDLNWCVYARAVIMVGRLRSPILRALHAPDRILPKNVPPDDVIGYCLANSDLSAFREDAARRGAVVLQIHNLRREIFDDALQSLNLPLSFIGRNLFRHTHPDDFHISTLETASIAMRMAKLIKLHRKAPRITRLLPDGVDAIEVSEVEVVGRRVPVSMGAASIAYFGRAPLYFARCHWDGHGFVVSAVPGPQLADCASLDEAKAAFLKFYAKCVAEQVTGPVRDLAFEGGVLIQLSRRNRT